MAGLCLSRRKDEQIVIGGGITITVVELRGDKVRLLIDAPKDVPIDRAEVHAAKLADGTYGKAVPNAR